ncbi:MAG: hypothetical protein IKU29_00600 [Parabacteroides sp.]|nr:hypothetical protein [Parabacteroides sp.]
MNNTNDNNVISPLLSSRFFCERFYGMEIFCPISKDSNLFQRVEIIDHAHFQIGDKILEYGDSMDDKYLLKNLERFTSENSIFNPEYYIEGERYMNWYLGCVTKLKKFTPTELTFDNSYSSDIYELYKKERTRSGYTSEFVSIWLRLGKNRIDDIVSDKQVISKDKLTETYDDNIPSIIIHDLEEGTIVRPRDISPDRTKLDINYTWTDIHADRYKYYQIKKTKSKVHLKAINIDDLKSDYKKSFDFNGIGEKDLLVIKTFNDDKYFVSNDRDAEKISAKNEDGKYRIISADEVSAIYVVDMPNMDDLIQTARIIQITHDC